MFQRLKDKWNVSWMRFILIFTTFALGGSLCGYLGRKFLLMLQIDATAIRIPLYILIVTILWPFCVLLISIPLGQFNFFRNYLARMGQRIAARGKATTRAIATQSVNQDSLSPGDALRIRQVAVFASGAGTNAKKIIAHLKNSDVGRVALIVCNNPKAGVLSVAADNNLPVLMVDRKGFYDNKNLLTELELHKVDLVVLAGFLWMIPQYLIEAYPDSIINIHPALLPKFGGKGMYGYHVHKAVIDAGEKESGITIHYVDEHYDNGDIIFQARCPVTENDTAHSLADKIHALEHEHYPLVVEDLLKR